VWPRGWVEVQLYSSMTTALEGGEWPAARPGRTLLPGKTQYPFYRRLGGSQGPSGRAENLVLTGIPTRTVQPVAQSLYRQSYRTHGKAMSIMYSEFVFVALGIQHAMCMRRINMCSLPSSLIFFPHFLTNGTIFEKTKVTEHKMYFDVWLTVHRSSMWIKRPTRCHF